MPWIYQKISMIAENSLMKVLISVKSLNLFLMKIIHKFFWIYEIHDMSSGLHWNGIAGILNTIGLNIIIHHDKSIRVIDYLQWPFFVLLIIQKFSINNKLCRRYLTRIFYTNPSTQQKLRHFCTVINSILHR